MSDKKITFKNSNYGSFTDEDFQKIFNEKTSKFKQTLENKLIISLFGEVNSGKSQTINALTGRKLSKVTAYAGETKEVLLHEYSKNVYIADTPGLNDINKYVSKRANEFVEKEADVILLFFNAAVGANKSAIHTYYNLKKLNKPIIIVLNKIDIWNDENGFDKKSFNEVVSQIEKETKQKVVAISAKKKIGIKKLNYEIINLLEGNGKDVLYSKISKFKETQVNTWINTAAVSSFGVGIIPLPCADMIPLTTIQVELAIKIAYIYDCKVDKDDIMTLIGSTITSSIGKQLFKLGVQGLKSLGWLGGPFGVGIIASLAGTIAASITYGFGWACNAYYKSGMTIELGNLGKIYKESYNNYYSINREIAATKIKSNKMDTNKKYKKS